MHAENAHEFALDSVAQRAPAVEHGVAQADRAGRFTLDKPTGDAVALAAIEQRSAGIPRHRRRQDRGGEVVAPRARNQVGEP